jgi:hypothetical protein
VHADGHDPLERETRVSSHEVSFEHLPCRQRERGAVGGRLGIASRRDEEREDGEDAYRENRQRDENLDQ